MARSQRIGAVVVAVAVAAAVAVGTQRPEWIWPDAKRIPDCRGLVGSPEDRLDSCLADLGSARLSTDATKQLRAMAAESRVLAVGPIAVDEVVFTGLEEVDGLREALMATDEAGVAAMLRAQGIAHMVVPRDLTLALDRDRTVLSRLAQHDHLEWHQLLRVTDDRLFYAVRDTTMRVPLADGQALVAGLRARLEGREVAPQSWRPARIRLLGGLRLQGSLLALRHAAVSDEDSQDIESVLDELADKLRREWSRKVEIEGHGALADRLTETRIEVHVVMERAPVEPRSQEALFDLWELGIDGMFFRQREGVEDEHFTFMPGSEAVTRSIRSPDAFLRWSTREFGWSDRRPWEKDRRSRLDLVRTQHFMEPRAGEPAIYLFRGMPEVSQDEVTDAEVQRMLAEGAEWWVHNQFQDGSFEYKFWPTQNRRSEEYNEVRHILGARDLADAWRYRNDPRFLAASRASMDWLMQFAVRSTDPPDGLLPHPAEGSLLFRYPSWKMVQGTKKVPNQKLGTVAVGLLGWVAWAKATGSHAEDDRIREMAKFTLSMLEADGRFKPYHVHKGHPYEHERNDIVPGEAALALGEVAEYFDEPEWVEFYPRFVAYYQPWFRQRAARKRPQGRWPHDTYENADRLDLVQFGPWSVMAAHQIYRITGDEAAADFGLEVADWMIDNYEWSEARSPWPDYVGGYYKLPNELPAMQTFCYSEGTAAAWGLAAQHAPQRKARYETATREAVRFLGVMQFDERDSYFLARPEKVRGGIKYAMNENKVRIDYVGHGLSTLVQFLDVRADEGRLEIRDPAAWAATPLRPPAVPLEEAEGGSPGLD